MDNNIIRKSIIKQRKNNDKADKLWYKLDLSAVVYPTLQRRDFSSVYRLSALMKKDVNPKVLQQALDETLKRFPSYKVAIRKGIFWRYLETNTRPGPFVKEDIKNPCMPMGFRTNNRYLIRLYYFGNRISFESHHCLGDGNGGMVVFNTILAQYLRLLGYSIPCEHLVKNINENPNEEEWEDAYMKYANAEVRPSRPGDEAYLIYGTPEPFYTLNMTIGTVDVNEVLAYTKKRGVSVTEYINALLLYALMKTQELEKPHKIKPLTLAMPVNLRRFFPSETLRNFITMVYPQIDPRLGNYSFDEILSQVHYYMRYYINDKFLNGDITTNAHTKKHPLIRIVPLCIKDIVVKHFYKSVQDRSSTMGITNMGNLITPAEMEEHIERFDICMGQPYSRKTNCSVISYKGIMSITFAGTIKETDTERFFFQKMVKDGIHVKIETNRS